MLLPILFPRRLGSLQWYVCPGAYVLSWRWDAEQTEQVWAQCGDVEIVSETTASSAAKAQGASTTGAATTAAVAKTRAAPVAATLPSGARHVCEAESLGLDVRDCDAWVDL
jgi:hypothetical protein